MSVQPTFGLEGSVSETVCYGLLLADLQFCFLEEGGMHKKIGEVSVPCSLFPVKIWPDT